MGRAVLSCAFFSFFLKEKEEIYSNKQSTNMT